MVRRPDHHRVVEQAGHPEFLKALADPVVHDRDVVVVAGDVPAHLWRVRQVGGHSNPRRVSACLKAGEPGIVEGEDALAQLELVRKAPAKHPALVGPEVAEHEEERLIGVSVGERHRIAAAVPDREGFAKLVVGFGIVHREVAGRTQPLGKRLDESRRHGFIGRPGRREGSERPIARPAKGTGAHVLGADGLLVHPGDQGGAAGRADSGRREHVGKAHAIGGQPVYVGRSRQRVTIGANARAEVLDHHEHDVRPRQAICKHRAGQHQRAHRKQQSNPGHHRRILPSRSRFAKMPVTLFTLNPRFAQAH